MDEWRNPLHGVLTQFTHLEVAEVPITFLLGFNLDYAAKLDGSVLPDVLRVLVLWNDLANLAGFEWYDCDVLDSIKRFLTHSRQSIPLSATKLLMGHLDDCDLETLSTPLY